MKIYAILLLLFSSVFSQLPETDSTWTVFVLDSLERSDYIGMYNYSDTLNVGGTEIHALQFADFDGDGFKNVVGALSYDSHLPDYPVVTPMDAMYMLHGDVEVYCAAVEYTIGSFEYTNFYGNNSCAVPFVADLEGDGEEDIFSMFIHWEDVDRIETVASYGSNVHSLDGSLKLRKKDRYFLADDLNLDGKMEFLCTKEKPDSIVIHPEYGELVYDMGWWWYLYEYDITGDSLILKTDLSAYDEYMGLSVYAAGDLTGDGFKELIIGHNDGKFWVVDKYPSCEVHLS